MTFNEYYSLTGLEKAALSPNSGNHDHQTIGRMMDGGLERKSANFVARSQTENPHMHPKLTACLNSKKNINLTSAEANQIQQIYGLYPTPQEPKKAIKQTGVAMVLMGPGKYVLTYQG